MAISVTARRYARTIFRMAQENKQLTQWQSDLRKIDGLLRDEALYSLLTNQKIPWSQKEQIFLPRLGEVNPKAKKLVALLAGSGKLALISEIAEEYQRLLDNYRGIEGAETAEVVTAIPLDAEYQLKLAQRITEVVGKPVILKTVVDPSIIGGIVIRIGDKLIDGSLRTKLAALRKELGGVA
jgi:F-type H+-transporting ATPase subunit delta